MNDEIADSLHDIDLSELEDHISNAEISTTRDDLLQNLVNAAKAARDLATELDRLAGLV